MKAFLSVGLIVFAISLNSCGALESKFGRLSGEETALTVVVNNPNGFSSMAWPNISGGIIVYIVGVDGTPFSTTIALNPAGGTSASADINVPNGRYRGYALAWDTAGLSGQAGCAVGNNPENFTGVPRTINVTLRNTDAECSFTTPNVLNDSGYSTASNFKNFTLTTCNGSVLSGCSGGSLSTTFSAGSVRVRMLGYVRHGADISYNLGLGLTGNCTNLTASAGTVTSVVPAGSTLAGADKFLAVGLELFTSGSCPGNPAQVIRFPNGLVNGSPNAPTAASPGSPYSIIVNVGS